MILVTGGSGFIGSHTVRALHGLGEPSVVMQRRSGQVPPQLADLPVAAEQADVADLGALRAIGERHQITGIVHLAGYPAPRGTAGGTEATAGLLDGLLNIARAAAEWDVRRVSLASTLGVYGGIAHSGPLTEDLPVPLTAPHPIPRSKKIAELLGEQLAEATGTQIVSLRISGSWGPLGHQDPFFAAPALIIWTLKNQLGLERHSGRIPAGLWARIIQRLLALNACIWHNWLIGAPVKRSLIAYDHI